MLFLESFSARDYQLLIRSSERTNVIRCSIPLPVWLVKELIEEYGEERACAIFKVSISVINPVFVSLI